MSGDAGGFIVGCAVLAAFPTILGVAAIGATAWGVAKVAGSAMKAAEKYHAEQVRSAAINSQEIRDLHLKMDEMLRMQAAQAGEIRREIAASCQADADRLQAMLAANASTEEMERVAQRMKHQLHQGVAGQLRALQKKQQAELQSHLRIMEQMQRTSRHLNLTGKADFHTVDAALRDAQATLETVQAHLEGADNAFRQQADLFAKRLDLARQTRTNAPETALSMACDIVSMGSVALMEELSRRQLRQALTDDLTTSLSALSERMTANRLISWEDDGQAFSDDLSCFTQGAWNEFEAHVQQLLASLPTLSVNELEALEKKVPALTARADAIVVAAGEHMTSFYRRQAAMDTLLEALEEQNYQLSFAAQPGDDPTQPITANAFRLDDASQSVTITLEDAPGHAMSLDMAMFGTDDESRKAHLRQLMTEKLRSSIGASASLRCSGAVDASSSRTQLTDEDFIRRQPVRKVNI